MAMNGRLLRPRDNFTPRSIPGLALWLDAADASSVTLNGSTVSEWRDKSGNGRNFAQSTAAAQPVYTTAGQNGRNCLTFDAARRLGSANTSSTWSFLHDGTSLYDIYVVYRTASGSTTIRTILATGNSGRNFRSFYFWHDHRSGQNNQAYFEITTVGTGTAGFLGNRGVSGLAANVMRLARVTGDPANATQANRTALVVAGSVGSVVEASTGTASAGDPVFTLTIGSLSNTAQTFGFAGDLCEIIIYSRSTAVTSGERTRIGNYLNSRWAL